MQENSPNSRLVEAFERLRYQKKVSTQIEFGEKLGYTKAHFSQIMNGAQPVTQKLATNIETVFGVSGKWLTDGVGTMFMSDTQVEEPATQYDTDTTINKMWNALNSMLSGFVTDKDLRELDAADQQALNDLKRSGTKLIERLQQKKK